MCELTMPKRELAAAAQGRARRPVPLPDKAQAPTATSMPAPPSADDPVADLEARLDFQQGLWSSRRLRVALIEKRAATRRR